MYERFYGLTERPFELTPNPRFLFLTRKHQEALGNLQHGIAQRKGVTLVLGPAGTGKTTIIRAALASMAGPHVRVVAISNPAMTRDEFLQTLAYGFGLSEEAGRSKAALLIELETRLLHRGDESVAALIVDEAQSMSSDLLEEVRLLVNIETDTAKLLPVVLVGQPELAARLNEPSAVALKQRVTLRCELGPLTLSETAQYITTRIKLAGGVPGQLFTREAVDLIHQRSGGIPRIISVICDNALLNGFALEQRPVGRKIVLEVCHDFDIPGQSTPQTPEATASAPPDEPPAAKPRPAPEEPEASEQKSTPPDSRLFGTFNGSTKSWFSKLVASR
jgi:general secretion pathway protein A